MTNCLVVDDSSTVRRVIMQIIQPIGFELSEAENGEEAMNLIQMQMPDVILLDWNMPVMDGITFLRQFRSLPNSQKCKVIFCTTMNDLPQIEEALDAGADEYIMKPFNEEIILNKFAQVGLVN